MYTRAVRLPIAVRAAASVLVVLAFTTAFPTLFRWNQPFAFTSTVSPVFIGGALLGWISGAVGGVAVPAIALFWTSRLAPTVMISVLPEARVLVTLALVALGVLVGWGRGILDRLRQAVHELEERERLKDLEAAYAIQQSLLPQRVPDTPGITWSWVCEPSAEVGVIRSATHSWRPAVSPCTCSTFPVTDWLPPCSRTPWCG